MIFFNLISIDHPMLLFSGPREKRNHNGLTRHTEECQVGMRPRRVFFDLLPQEEIVLEFLPPGWALIQYQRVSLKILLRQESRYQISISLLIRLDDCIPLVALLRQVSVQQFPASWSDVRCLVRNTLRTGSSKFLHIDNGVVQYLDEPTHFVLQVLRNPVEGELLGCDRVARFHRRIYIITRLKNWFVLPMLSASPPFLTSLLLEIWHNKRVLHRYNTVRWNRAVQLMCRLPPRKVHLDHLLTKWVQFLPSRDRAQPHRHWRTLCLDSSTGNSYFDEWSWFQFRQPG